MLSLPGPAQQPTLYFIGVTTAQSSIMRLFPEWAQVLGIEDAVIKGIDLDIHAPVEDYRQCVEFIKNDPLSMGALVTTHKIDIYNAANDLFDVLDPYAVRFGEISSISKRDNRLIGHAKDPITSGKALDAFIPEHHWAGTNAEVVVLGAGGSALAISAYLAQAKFAGNYPGKIHLTNRSAPRLASANKILSDLPVPMSFHLCPEPGMNDRIVESVPAGSLIVNATGLGKDRPGSPLTDQVQFPDKAIIWELNYRGTLEFLQQAKKAQSEKNLLIEDGWTYFIHGWTEVISEVFDSALTQDKFHACEKIARSMRK